MKVAVVGGGLLGMTVAYRLAGLGHQVELFEAAPSLGGLSVPHQFGPFVWDRFYHCILPTDSNLIGLISELGLKDDLRWTRTGTGYYADGRFFSMSGNADFLRFPLVSLADKARLAALVMHATHTARPYDLYGMTAQDWLIRWCGRRGYEIFWRPLLRAKFGPYYDQIAAVFIWATLSRLQGARQGTGKREHLGYVRGGYASILRAFRQALEARGAGLHTSSPVQSISTAGPATVRLTCGGTATTGGEFDQVIFTGPTRLARRTVSSDLLPVVEEAETRYPTSEHYLGVACLTLVLRRPLTPYYVLNIADPSVELTGLVEMTNLIDRHAETLGYSLLYLPRYLDNADPTLDGDDHALTESILARGVRRLYPDLTDEDIVDRQVHRAHFVQPLPLVRHGVVEAQFPSLRRPLAILNSSMLECATLNNNEVVGLANRFVSNEAVVFADAHRDRITAQRDGVPRQMRTT
jgi:protoporphyrinogen oxidase